MTRRTRDRLTALVLLATLVVLAIDLLRPRAGQVWVPMTGDVEATAASMGEVVTIEDLVRLVVAMEEGEALGLPPLDDAARAELGALIEQARRDRDAVAALDGAMGRAQGDLRERTVAMAALLTPEQQAWILDQRDRVSVGEVEDAYWQRAEDLLR